MNRNIKISALIFGIFAILFAILFPEYAINPGKLSHGHDSLSNNCLKCHDLFKGISKDKCMKCHKLDSISISKSNDENSFLQADKYKTLHRFLNDINCMNCHNEHKYSKFIQNPDKFEHIYFKPSIVNNCVACHIKPNDNLHRSIDSNCSSCHTNYKWKPANYNHDKYFVFDNDHKTNCSTCHNQGNFKTYTCYGCHEHTQEKISEEHLEEGIRNFENCAKCHKSANKHDAEKGEGKSEHESNGKSEND